MGDTIQQASLGSHKGVDIVVNTLQIKPSVFCCGPLISSGML